MNARIAAIVALLAAALKDRRVAAIATAAVMVAAAFGAVQLVDSNGDGKADQVVIPLPATSGAPAHTVVADKDHQAAAQKPGAPEGVLAHEDAVDELPPGVTPKMAATARRTVPAGPPVELGGAQVYSCPDRFVRNYSSRHGVTAIQFVIHYTVSAPGSMPAIWRLFDTPSFGASSDYLLELKGDCLHIVPFGFKSWTQGAMNPPSRSVEIASYDMTRAQWLASPIISRGILAGLIADNLKRMGSPPKLVDPVGCTPLGGWTDHRRLECGNDHTDVGNNFPFDVVQQQVIRSYYGGDPVKPAAPPVTPKALTYCKQLNRYRRIRAAGGQLSPGQTTRAVRLKRALDHKYRCGRHGNVTVVARR